MGFCPWHTDDKPSFIVTPEKNLWHCMGACDEGGDMFNLVQKMEKVSFRRDADILFEISGSMPTSQTIETHTGNPVQMYGRKITAGLRKGTPDHLYLEQPVAGVWNLEGCANQKQWILCECIIDALTLWCQGLRNVTCCFGKNTFTDDMWSVLRKIRPTKVIVAFDNDDSGNKAAEKRCPVRIDFGRLGKPPSLK